MPPRQEPSAVKTREHHPTVDRGASQTRVQPLSRPANKATQATMSWKPNCAAASPPCLVPQAGGEGGPRPAAAALLQRSQGS